MVSGEKASNRSCALEGNGKWFGISSRFLADDYSVG
jgi:hypothetical protein